jgi:hypothetical protein
VGLWNSTLVYVGARTLLAAAMIVLLLHRRRGIWFSAGQIVSDLSCAAFLLGYVNPDIREDVGILVLPLLAFVVFWELTRFFTAQRGDAEEERDDSLLGTVGRAYATVWLPGFVAPAVVAGGFLVFDLLFPRAWSFPNPRPALACTPRHVEPGGSVALRMAVPHGAELTVFTPARRALVVVPFQSKVTRQGRGFADVERFTLHTDSAAGRALPDTTLERVFVDPGVYVVRISEEAEISASRTCRLRFGKAPLH